MTNPNAPTPPRGEQETPTPITSQDRELAKKLVRPFLDMQGLDAIEAAERACQIIADHQAAHSSQEIERLRGALEEIENRCRQVEGLSPTGIETECLRVARAALAPSGKKEQLTLPPDQVTAQSEELQQEAHDLQFPTT